MRRLCWLMLLVVCGRAMGAEMTLVAFGDSTTAKRGELRIFADLLAEELPERGVRATVVNAGVGGNTTAMARKRFEADVLAHGPDVVTILFGLNDASMDVWKGVTEPRVPLAQYEANLRYFVDKVREQGGKPILMTPNRGAWTPKIKELYGKPPYDADDPDGYNVLLKDYAAAVRRIAKEMEVTLIDVYAVFEAYAQEHSIHDLLLDGIHPNDKGHRMIADAILKEVAPEE